MSIKVLHLGQTIGGLDIYIRNTCRYLPSNFEFVIVRGVDDDPKPFVNINKEFIPEYKIPLYRKISPINDVKSIIRAVRIVRDEKPDVIHAHSAKGGLVGRIVGVLTGRNVLYTPHAFSFLSSPKKSISYFYKVLERLTRFNAFLLACSESEGKLGRIKVGYAKNKTLVWSNSVPDRGHSFFQTYKEVKSSFLVTVGRPCFQKNTLFLIEVVKKVVKSIPDFKIMILGVGHHSPELSAVEEKIKILKLEENIILVPWLDQVKVLEYIAASKFYVTMAHYEGLPLAVLEAMALGKAIVASDVPGNNDCVNENQNGFLLPLDHDIFADHIITLWENDVLRNEFERKSREIFTEKFDIEKNILKLMHIYNSFAN